MNEKLLVPDIGDFEEVEIIEILVKEGDKISKNDPVITLESDKSSVEVPSTFDGIIDNITIANGNHVDADHVVMTVKQLTDSGLPARAKAQSANNSTSDLAEQATVTPPLSSKFNVSLIIALAVGALAILFVVGN